jgi:ferredoxin
MTSSETKARIFTFSGTGNSLWAAKALQERIDGSVVSPMAGWLRSGINEAEEPVIGFVFPIHAFTLPRLMKRFLRKLRLPNAGYLFAVATRGGSPCHVFRHLDKALRRFGKSLDAAYYLDMPNNYLLYWDAPDEETFERLNAEATGQVQRIAEAVIQRKPRQGYEHGYFTLEHILFPLLSVISSATRYFGLEKCFEAEEACTGCGLCERVCVSEKITMKGKKPVWDPTIHCEFCFACIHFCPVQAIQLRSTKSKARGRYHHPQVTAEDIGGQKDRLEYTIEPEDAKAAGG